MLKIYSLWVLQFNLNLHRRQGEMEEGESSCVLYSKCFWKMHVLCKFTPQLPDSRNVLKQVDRVLWQSARLWLCEFLANHKQYLLQVLILWLLLVDKWAMPLNTFEICWQIIYSNHSVTVRQSDSPLASLPDWVLQ